MQDEIDLGKPMYNLSLEIIGNMVKSSPIAIIRKKRIIILSILFAISFQVCSQTNSSITEKIDTVVADFIPFIAGNIYSIDTINFNGIVLKRKFKKKEYTLFLHKSLKRYSNSSFKKLLKKGAYIPIGLSEYSFSRHPVTHIGENNKHAINYEANSNINAKLIIGFTELYTHFDERYINDRRALKYVLVVTNYFP